MTRKYVLEGGPGTGKSTLLTELQKRGIYTMKEVAEYLIQRELNMGGNILPWSNRDAFQKRLLETQIEWESEIPRGAGISFQDSGIPRGIAYYRIDNLEPSQKLITASKNAKYEKVFFLDTLKNYQRTEIRSEDREKALKIHEETKKVYQEMGYELIRIPDSSLNYRTELILDLIGFNDDRKAVIQNRGVKI